MADLRSEEPCELLQWDSDFWGFPVARVRGHSLTPERMAAIDLWCQERQIACLYFLATFDDPLTVRCAEEGQFHLVDARVTFAISSTSAIHGQESPGVTIRPVATADVHALRRMAGESFRETRFFFDQHFPRARCRQFYEDWIVESCRGYADRVFVAHEHESPVGYITCHVPRGDEETGRIGLLNVAADVQRRGIGRALRQSALEWFAEQSVPRVTATTQARNIAMLVLNQRCGFVTQSFQLWYHKWYHPPNPESP
jgi:dTDP-4-amino-4,6-dideoxy-D-galactose acyltransferase